MHSHDKVLISVIIPIYNGAGFIEKAVNSAILQKEVGEIIIIDDASTDTTAKICRNLQAIHPTIKYIHLPDNRGPAAARNRGLKEATGTYITFLDCDDYYLEGRFEKSVNILTHHPEVDGVYTIVKNTGIEKYNEKHTQSPVLGISKTVNPDDLFSYMVEDRNELFHLSAITFRKKALEKTGYFDEQFRYSEDLDFMYSLALHCSLVRDQETAPKIVRVVHGQNMTLDSSYNPETARFPLVEKWYEWMIKKGFDRTSNWYLMRRYLHMRVYRIKNNLPGWLRIPLKLIIIIEQMVIRPKLIIRLVYESSQRSQLQHISRLV